MEKIPFIRLEDENKTITSRYFSLCPFSMIGVSNSDRGNKYEKISGDFSKSNVQESFFSNLHITNGKYDWVNGIYVLFT